MRTFLQNNNGQLEVKLSKAGSTLNGSLILPSDPNDELEAVTKQYVDNSALNLSALNFTHGVLPIGRLPALTGDIISVNGSNNISLKPSGVSNGVHSKVTVNAKGIITGNSALNETDIPSLPWSKITSGKPSTLNGYGITNALSKTGGAITGPLILANDPVSLNQLVTKQYVDNSVNKIYNVKIGEVIRKPYATTPAGFLKCNGGIVSKSAYSNLYSVIGDQFYAILDPGSGKPWQRQYNINTTQSTDITGWTTGTSLPTAILVSQAVVTKNRVYLLGGYNGTTTLSTVYTAPINADGTLGTWTAGASLPAAIHGSQAIVAKNRVYLLGGYNGTSLVSTVYTAPINADGTLGAWTTDTSLPEGLVHSQAIVTKNRVYMLGGVSGTGNLSTVYTSIINSDGTLGEWTTGTSLPGARHDSCAIVTKNRVYLVGGDVGVDTSPISSVITAPINADGTLGAWTTATPLPSGLQETQSIVTANRVYLLGGDTGSPNSIVYTAPINGDGTLGTWSTGTPLPGPLDYAQAIVTSSRVYLLGGSAVYTAPIAGGLNDYSLYYNVMISNTNFVMPGSGKPWQRQYSINTTQSADITGWTTVAALPGALAHSQAIVTKNRVYLLGGYNGTSIVSTVYTAPINADGTLGTWTAGTSLPAAVYVSQSIVTKNRVYLLGGRSGTSPLSTVYTAPINADGTLGTWTTGTPLPGVMSFSQAIVTKNRVYLLGGNNGTSPLSTVYTAPINADGTLGTWTAGTSLPGIRHDSCAVVTKNRVYLIGGDVGVETSPISSVITAVINTDGTLGTWTTATPLPSGLQETQSIVTANRVYLLGGDTGSTNSIVYTAPINADGTLGTWTTGTPLPGPLEYSQAIVTSSRVYLLGGHNGTSPLSTVYTAPIAGGLNDYSDYFDGTILPADSSNLSLFFALPDITTNDNLDIYHYIKF